MSICRDVSTKHLRDIGFNPIRLPSENVKPYDILFRKPGTKSKTSLVGALQDFTKSPSAKDFPLLSQDLQTTNIQGTQSSEFQIDFGLSILNNLLSALGGGGGNLSTAYQNAKQIQFTYNNVSLDVIRRGALANFLSEQAIPKLDSPFLNFFDEEGEAYMIVEIAKSNQFEVEAFDENGVSIGVDVAGILGAIGGNVNVKSDSDANKKLTYEGEVKIPFAFKAVPFWLDVTVPMFRISPFGGQVVILESTSAPNQEEFKDEILGSDERRLISIKKISMAELDN